MDPFQAALDAIFSAPGSAAATYNPAADDPAQIRVIVSRPDDTANFRGSPVVQSTCEITFRKADVPMPQRGETVRVEGGAFLLPTGSFTDTLRLSGDPMIDVEGITWTCGAEPV